MSDLTTIELEKQKIKEEKKRIQKIKKKLYYIKYNEDNKERFKEIYNRKIQDPEYVKILNERTKLNARIRKENSGIKTYSERGRPKTDFNLYKNQLENNKEISKVEYVNFNDSSDEDNEVYWRDVMDVEDHIEDR
jgi:hypothetical protein